MHCVKVMVGKFIAIFIVICVLVTILNASAFGENTGTTDVKSLMGYARYDEDGNIEMNIEYTYDEMGRVKTESEYWNNELNRMNVNTYDDMGNLVNVISYDGNGNVSFTIDQLYDENGNVVCENTSYGLKRSFTYSYNEDGNIEKMEEWYDGEEVAYYTVLYSYDAEGKMIRKREYYSLYPQMNMGEEYIYDSYGNVILCVKYDRDGVYKGHVMYVYDEDDRLIKEVQTGSCQIDYIYNDDGNVTTRYYYTLASGDVKRYEYYYE